MVPENVTVFIGEQHFDIEDLDYVAQNRYNWEWNVQKGKYIRLTVGERFENLHDSSKEGRNVRCP